MDLLLECRVIILTQLLAKLTSLKAVTDNALMRWVRVSSVKMRSRPAFSAMSA